MRSPMFVAIPFALLVAATPAQGQGNGGLHINLPIIGHGNDYRRGPVHEVRVYQYPPVPYGQYKKKYRKWNRVPLYVVDGRYYDSPIRGGRPVYVYRDHGRYFWGPGDGNWDRWDSWDGGRNGYYDRDQYVAYDRNRDGRDDRYEYRARRGKGSDRDRSDQNDRDDRDDRWDGRDDRSYPRPEVRRDDRRDDSRPTAGQGDQGQRPEAGRGNGNGNGKGNGNGRGRRGN